MPRFRPPIPGAECPPAAVTADQVRRLAAELLAPRHFFVSPGFHLEIEHLPNEELFWEIIHGRLLDRPQTNRRQTFESWNLYLTAGGGRPPEPLVSLKLDAV